MKLNKRKILIIILIFILVFSGVYLLFPIHWANENTQNSTNEVTITEQLDENTITTQDIQVEDIVTPEVEETYTTMYVTALSGLNIREGIGTDAKIYKSVVANTALEVVDNSEQDGWVKIKLNDKNYYVCARYLSKTKITIKEPVTSRGANERVNTTIKKSSSGVLTKSKGVNYFNGHKETWYSQKVLPGGGLRIPGRHVNSQGLVCDKNGYICVASSDYSKGTIVETSLGTGKVYDCGCASGIIDIYTNW